MNINVTAGLATASHAYTFFSLPLSQGEWRGAGRVVLEAEGSRVSAQTWPLAYWPDGSLRIVRGIAPLQQGSYQVSIEAEGGKEDANGGLRWEAVGNAGRILNGAETLEWDDSRIFSGRFDLGVEVEWANGDKAAAEMEGEVAVKREGALYMQIERWAKVVVGSQYLRFRFQFDVFYGIPGMAVNVMMVNDCPGLIFQEIATIHLQVLQAGADPVVFQKEHGFECLESRFVALEERGEIRVDASQFLPYIRDGEALRDETVYPHYLRPPACRVGSAVFLKKESGVLQMEMEDFHLLRPKGMFLEPGQVTFALWPGWTEQPLRLQQGKRRQVRLAFFWGHDRMPVAWKEVEAASASLLDLYRSQLPAEVYGRARFFDQSRVLPFRPDLYPRFEGWLKVVSSLQTVADFFHLGDTPDGHYQTTYIPSGSCRRKSPGVPPKFFTTSGRYGQCFDQLGDYETIWVNNEYDVLFALGTEYLRNGNQVLYQQLRWFARHTVEVDFLCYSDYPSHHRAQPAHSEDHTSAGAYPSHFWTQGLAQYYFLSGDEDVLEVIIALADKTIWYFDHPVLGGLHSGVNREMGWAVLTLVSAAEATGDRQYDDYAKKMIDVVIAEPLPEDLPDFNFGYTSLLLGCRAYLERHRDSKESQLVWEWYLKVLNLAICSSTTPPLRAGKLSLKLSYDYELAERGEMARLKPRPGLLNGFAAPDCLAYAHERTGDSTYLRAGIRALQAFLDDHPGYYHQAVFSSFRTPLPEGKPFAVAYRTWINYLGALDRVGWLQRFDYESDVTLT